MNNRQAQNTNDMNVWPIPYDILSEVWLINFGGFDITECDELYIREYDYDDLGEIVLEAIPYPFIDGGAVLSYLTEKKVLNFKMIIRSDTQEILNDKIDDIKRRLVRKEQPLDIVVNGKRRRTLASLTDLKFNRDLNNQSIQMDVDIQFTTYSPHFRLKDPVSASSTLQTVNFFDIDLDNDGSAPTDYEIYVIFGTWNVGITNITLTQNGFPVSANLSINDGDVVVFSSLSFQVLQNWIEKDYDWQFQRVDLGSNPMQIVMNGSNRNYGVTTKFLQQYR